MRNLNSSKSGLVSLLGAVTIATLLVIAVVYGVYTFNAYASSAHQFQGATNLSSSTNSTSTSPTTTNSSSTASTTTTTSVTTTTSSTMSSSTTMMTNSSSSTVATTTGTNST